MTTFDPSAAAAPESPPVAPGARPAPEDRLDTLHRHVCEGLGLTTVDAVNLVKLAQAYRDGDDLSGLELLDRLDGLEGDSDE